MWNDLPAQIVMVSTTRAFKNQLKAHLQNLASSDRKELVNILPITIDAGKTENFAVDILIERTPSAFKKAFCSTIEFGRFTTLIWGDRDVAEIY